MARWLLCCAAVAAAAARVAKNAKNAKEEATLKGLGAFARPPR